MAQHITQERLKERLLYNPDDGLFTWLPAKGRLRAGTVAGIAHCKGYRAVTLDGRKYLLHRLAWIYVNGAIPEGREVDHKNGHKADNRIKNLRLATRQQNQENFRRCRSDSKSGLQGAIWRSQNSKWVARIMTCGKRQHLGTFESAEEAHQAYLEAKRRLHSFCTI